MPDKNHDDMEVSTSIKLYFRQYLLAFATFLQTNCAGCALAYSSILISQLDESSEIILDTEQSSWIASIPVLSMLPVVLLTGWILNLLGRRRTLILLITMTLISWIMTYLASSYATMFISRLIAGIMLGSYTTMMVFLGEAVQPNIRPFCLTSVPMGWNLSILITQLLGYYIHWRTIALIMCIVAMCNLLICFYLADSYIWLLNKNNVDEAKRTFVWYRGFGYKAKKEFLAALDSKNKEINFSVKEKLKLCCTKEFLMPFRLTAILYLTCEFTGDTAVVFYTSAIIKLISPEPNVQFYGNLILNIIRLMTTIASLYLLRRYSIRKVLCISGFALAGSLGCLSLGLYFNGIFPQQNAIPIICLVLIICDVIFYGVGYSPVSIIICGEMYPAAVREIGGTLSVLIGFTCIFLTVKFLPYFFVHVHPSVIFLVFACCTFTGTGVLCFIMPETKNKTLKEIENIYEK